MYTRNQQSYKLGALYAIGAGVFLSTSGLVVREYRICGCLDSPVLSIIGLFCHCGRVHVYSRR